LYEKFLQRTTAEVQIRPNAGLKKEVSQQQQQYEVVAAEDTTNKDEDDADERLLFQSIISIKCSNSARVETTVWIFLAVEKKEKWMGSKEVINEGGRTKCV